MKNNYKSFLYAFDLLGMKPQLRIFNNKSYKSLFSSLTSIIILVLCIAFSIYSIIIYFKFENPSVTYSKDNDKSTNRVIFLKDTLLMFKFIETSSLNINNEIPETFFSPFHVNAYYNGTYIKNQLTTEKCELGKNINIKYKSIVEEMKKAGNSIDEFYCFSHIHGNYSLSFIPEIGYSSIYLYLTINKNNNRYSPDELQSIIISENDIIDHNNKENPVLQSYIYHFTPSFSYNEYTKINFNFQYIKYESDNNLIFKTSKILDAKSFSDINYYKYINDNYNDTNYNLNPDHIRIGEIIFEINKSFFDHYKRTYPKIQTLLTEIMAVFNLLFGIGEQIFNILLSKKMSKDIVRALLNNNIDDINNHQRAHHKIKIDNNLFKENENENNNKTSSNVNMNINLDRKVDIQKKLNEKIKTDQIDQNIKKMDTLEDIIILP